MLISIYINETPLKEQEGMVVKMVNRIAEQRIKQGLTVEQLSEKSGIAPNELKNIECDSCAIEEVSAVKAAAIAEALGCLIKDLIYEDQ